MAREISRCAVKLFAVLKLALAAGQADSAGEKKPRGKELTPAEGRHNRALSRVRIRVEHAISGIKRARCVKDILRNTQAECSDGFMEAATGFAQSASVLSQARLAPMSGKPYF